MTPKFPNIASFLGFLIVSFLYSIMDFVPEDAEVTQHEEVTTFKRAEEAPAVTLALPSFKKKAKAAPSSTPPAQSTPAVPPASG